jgi:hypothetical protein
VSGEAPPDPRAGPSPSVPADAPAGVFAASTPARSSRSVPFNGCLMVMVVPTSTGDRPQDGAAQFAVPFLSAGPKEKPRAGAGQWWTTSTADALQDPLDSGGKPKLHSGDRTGLHSAKVFLNFWRIAGNYSASMLVWPPPSRNRCRRTSSRRKCRRRPFRGIVTTPPGHDVRLFRSDGTAPHAPCRLR